MRAEQVRCQLQRLDGRGGEASGLFSSVSGGEDNKASEFASSVSGGRNNVADGNFSIVVGGNGNSTTTDDEIAPYSIVCFG